MTGAQSVGGYSRRGGDDLGAAMWALAGPQALTFVLSCLQAASALNICNNPVYSPIVGQSCSGLYAYSCALGIVSAIIIGVNVIVFFFAKNKLPEKTLYYVSMLLFLWWIAGVGATTFQSTGVLVSGTGYFASWGCLMFSGMILYNEHAQFREVVDAVNHLEAGGQSTFYMLLASVVEVFSAIEPCVKTSCGPLNVYALILGISSVIFCLLLLRVDPGRMKGADRAVAVFLVIWWTVGMGIVTIDGYAPPRKLPGG